MVDPETGEEITQETPASYDVTIRRIKPKDQVVIEAVPPEEILISRNARDLESSPYVAHRMVKTISDLVAMGYDKDEMEQYAGSGNYVDADKQVFHDEWLEGGDFAIGHEHAVVHEFVPAMEALSYVLPAFLTSKVSV